MRATLRILRFFTEHYEYYPESRMASQMASRARAWTSSALGMSQQSRTRACAPRQECPSATEHICSGPQQETCRG